MEEKNMLYLLGLGKVFAKNLHESTARIAMLSPLILPNAQHGNIPGTRILQVA